MHRDQNALGKDAQELIFEGATPGIKFALGENPKRAGAVANLFGGGRPPRYPATRMGVEDVIREAFLKPGVSGVLARVTREDSRGENVPAPARSETGAAGGGAGG